MASTKGKFWGYLGRFTIVHVLVYGVTALVFLAGVEFLPEATQTALQTFGPYRPLDAINLTGQVLRGILLAIVLYPFYGSIMGRKRGWLFLLAALWGVLRVGSVDPMPGSIEGVIYTEVPLLGHVIGLLFALGEVLIFSQLFLRWETSQTAVEAIESPDLEGHERFSGFIGRFTLLHVLTYALAGILLFTLQNYEEAFAVQQQFELFRPLDHPLVMAAIPIQILRGGLLAAFFFPFYGTFIKRGWSVLFGLVLGLIALGSPGFIPGLLSDMVSGKPFAEFLIGPVEIVVQMLLFSTLLYLWERRSFKKAQASSES